MLLAGCSPHANWREFTSKDASYQVLFPAKPATASRAIDLDGTQTTMTMDAAEMGDVVFAVGRADVPDAAAASAGLIAMQTALVKNIDGAVTRNATATATNDRGTRITRDIEALGTRSSEPMRLVAHFEARGKTLYQVIVAGPAKSVHAEQTEQFIDSFKVLK